MPLNESWTWPAIVFVGHGGGIGGLLGGEGGLSNRREMLSFTLMWTLAVFGLVFGVAGLVAASVPLRVGRPLTALVLFLIVAGFGMITALIGGSLMGYFIGSIYEIGGFTMALWVPLGWAVVQLLVAVISSYAEVGLNAL
ncbi:hypothetical protein HDU80_009329 [Chytriomyces hyalinus]|nr:hypothetical protein HDU80_009329 [Chytriomyces hyalinus]